MRRTVGEVMCPDVKGGGRPNGYPMELDAKGGCKTPQLSFERDRVPNVRFHVRREYPKSWHYEITVVWVPCQSVFER